MLIIAPFPTMLNAPSPIVLNARTLALTLAPYAKLKGEACSTVIGITHLVTDIVLSGQ